LPVSLDCPFLIAPSVFSDVCYNIVFSIHLSDLFKQIRALKIVDNLMARCVFTNKLFSENELHFGNGSIL